MISFQNNAHFSNTPITLLRVVLQVNVTIESTKRTHKLINSISVHVKFLLFISEHTTKYTSAYPDTSPEKEDDLTEHITTISSVTLHSNTHVMLHAVTYVCALFTAITVFGAVFVYIRRKRARRFLLNQTANTIADSTLADMFTNDDDDTSTSRHDSNESSDLSDHDPIQVRARQSGSTPSTTVTNVTVHNPPVTASSHTSSTSHTSSSVVPASARLTKQLEKTGSRCYNVNLSPQQVCSRYF